MSLSRLYGGNSRKNSAGRGSTEKPPTDGGSSTTGGSPTEIKATKQRDVKVKSTEKDPKDEKEKDTKENPALLRKRTSSQDGGIPTRGMQALKPGQSILQQIGQPDHVGWMRKKGDRYNSWKQRYFVLKGPHLYILKSESKSVSTSVVCCGICFELFSSCRKRRSRDMSTSLGTRFLPMRILILDDMASESYMTPTRRIFSARPNRELSGSG